MCEGSKNAMVKQPIHWYLGGRVAVIQQITIVWVGSPFMTKNGQVGETLSLRAKLWVGFV